MTERKSESDNEKDTIWEEEENNAPPRLSAALSELQEMLEKERDGRREERFLWICLLLVVFDVHAFGHMATWAGPIVLGILELLFLTVAGRVFGIDEIYTFTMKALEALKKNG